VSRGTVLVVDDEPGIREQLAAILGDEGFVVISVGSGEEALGALGRDIVDVVLLDLLLPGIDGLAALRSMRAAGFAVPVVAISGHASPELAVRAIREGAADFLEKPLALERVLVTVGNVIAQARLAERLAQAQDEDEPVLTGTSPAIVSLRRQILLAAPSDARVLITGPNGSGKEVVAHMLHALSRRSHGPFVAVNCAAIPEELIESELFGHVRGAFTGAVDSKRGKFELADSGTLLLDEVGDMSLLTQAKVLRVLQDASFSRIGGTQELQVDVRVVAASNKDLEAEIVAGRFREDLFYRLNVIALAVPPLAARGADVPLLLAEFTRQLARRLGVAGKRFSDEAISTLVGYDWPGNVRELRNLVERVMIMVEGAVVTPEDLPLRPGRSSLAPGGPLLTLRAARAGFERAYVDRVVEACGGNMSAAARVLGLERSHLYRKRRALARPPR
jgi:two-component system nitrogen regulation response regulator NtrX